jgi:hypothetical protein
LRTPNICPFLRTILILKFRKEQVLPACGGFRGIYIKVEGEGEPGIKFLNPTYVPLIFRCKEVNLNLTPILRL